MQNVLPHPLSRRLDSHFLTSSAVVAGVTIFSAVQADAAVVYSGIVNAAIAPTSVNGGTYFDFENPSMITYGATFTNWDVNPYASGTKLYIAGIVDVVVGSGSSVLNLPAGTTIGSASTFNTTDGVFDIPIAAGSTGILGFQFTSNNNGGPTVYYGWARFTPQSSGNGAIVDFAYENSGAPILAGAIPEPSSLALLAFGSLGLTQIRRRRAA